jgi:hypothetical protein
MNDDYNHARLNVVVVVVVVEKFLVGVVVAEKLVVDAVVDTGDYLTVLVLAQRVDVDVDIVPPECEHL